MKVARKMQCHLWIHLNAMRSFTWWKIPRNLITADIEHLIIHLWDIEIPNHFLIEALVLLHKSYSILPSALVPLTFTDIAWCHANTLVLYEIKKKVRAIANMNTRLQLIWCINKICVEYIIYTIGIGNPVGRWPLGGDPASPEMPHPATLFPPCPPATPLRPLLPMMTPMLWRYGVYPILQFKKTASFFEYSKVLSIHSVDFYF